MDYQQGGAGRSAARAPRAARVLAPVSAPGGVPQEESLRVRALLSDLTLRLLDTPADQLSRRVRETLETLARTLGFDRGGLARFESGGQALIWTESFSLPGIPSGEGEDLDRESPWFTEQVRLGRTLVLSHLPEDLPRAAAKEIARVRALGLKSNLTLPLKSEGAVLGALGFGTFRAYRSWTPDLVSSLELLAGGLAAALRQATVAHQLKSAEGLNQSLLVSFPAPLAVIDADGRLSEASTEWASARRCPECPRAVRRGRDFLRAWQAAPPELQRAAPAAAESIRAVIDGRRSAFDFALDCARGDVECHTRITVSPLHGRGGGAVILETDGSEVHRMKAELATSRREMRDLRDRLDADALYRKRDVQHTQGFEQMVGNSGSLAKVLHQIEQVAGADAPILILGETGTGKDLVARALHERSRRKDKPLVAVNCAALPESLIESELFGYEKGAFTGAVQRTMGRFEVANGGSILLDEIGELPLAVQAKLLRVLEGGTFERLGASKTVQVNVRVLAATNRDLEKEVREGRFRADLFYRLNVFPITVPPLRDRREDVALLVWHFINARQGPLGRRIASVPERLMKALQGYSWPGNVRELENVVERALILTRASTLEIDAAFLSAPDEGPAGTRLDDVQRNHIRAVLRQCGWKLAGRGNAAERLGLKRATLQHRMKVLGITRPEKETSPM